MGCELLFVVFQVDGWLFSQADARDTRAEGLRLAGGEAWAWDAQASQAPRNRYVITV